MKKLVLIVFVVGIFCPTLLFGQTITPSLIPTGFSAPSMGEGGLLSGMPLLKGLKTGNVLLNPYVQIGYQRTGVNLNVPIDASIDPPLPFPHLTIGTIDVKLVDYNFWTGTVGLNAVISPTFTVFGAATGFLPRDFQELGQLPISLGPMATGIEFKMTGSNFEYWAVQGGISYGIGQGNSLLLGFLWCHTASVYTNPRTVNGPAANQTIFQDFLLKNWAPFIGLQTMQPGFYRAALTYSPFMGSRGTLRQTSTSPVNDESWDLNQPGWLVSLTGEYYVPLSKTQTFSVWATATASRIRGSSEFVFQSAVLNNTRNVDNLTLSQYSIGGGLSLSLVF